MKEEFMITQRIICCNNDIEKQTILGLASLEFTDQDYQKKLSKQKGLIEYLQFHLSIEEQRVSQEEFDLELIEKEFGELFIEQSPSQLLMEKIIEGLSLSIDKQLKNGD